ncbi:MAG TPA: tetraacyldisaccharide 4'-kinase [Bacteroidales bacterium]|nr:tetraacyldisaccharide 4'-kinase [Bacteroidales bacterium]
MFNNRNFLLYPLSIVYGIITGIRNFLYNSGFLGSAEFDIPVICIGNITIGGTGKTPHTEYVARLLSGEYRVAILSRGYKRKTNEFIIGTEESSVDEIGDEPLQMLKKMPGVTVAADRSRVNGINNLLKIRPETEVVILDDAFQHRQLKPGLMILLIDYARPLHKDHMIPYGSLREYRNNIRRADIIMVTKSPSELSPMQKRIDMSDIPVLPYQSLYFTSLKYREPLPVFETAGKYNLEWNSFQDNGVVIITGIANPAPLIQYLQRVYSEIKHLSYPDHHSFNENDVTAIISAWKELNKPVKYIITTEKDAMRLRVLNNLPDNIKEVLYFIPIGIEFRKEDKEHFDKQIIDYVRKNRRNERFS